MTWKCRLVAHQAFYCWIDIEEMLRYTVFTLTTKIVQVSKIRQVRGDSLILKLYIQLSYFYCYLYACSVKLTVKAILPYENVPSV